MRTRPPCRTGSGVTRRISGRVPARTSSPMPPGRTTGAGSVSSSWETSWTGETSKSAHGCSCTSSEVQILSIWSSTIGTWTTAMTPSPSSVNAPGSTPGLSDSGSWSAGLSW